MFMVTAVLEVTQFIPSWISRDPLPSLSSGSLSSVWPGARRTEETGSSSELKRQPEPGPQRSRGEPLATELDDRCMVVESQVESRAKSPLVPFVTRAGALGLTGVQVCLDWL
jgi:hypothetical protein